MNSFILTQQAVFFLGVVHAIEPGHGKTAMFAYMTSSRRTIAEAFVLSLGSALFHSLSVFLIALATHFFSKLLVGQENANPDKIAHVLEVVSAFLIFLMGLYLLQSALKKTKHSHDDDHHHHHHHDHQKRSKSPLMMAAFLSLSTGLMPCPTTLAAYLAGLRTGNTEAALWSLVIFSLGVALTLLGLALSLRFVGKKIASKKFSLKWEKPIELFRAILILGIGVVYLSRLNF